MLSFGKTNMKYKYIVKFMISVLWILSKSSSLFQLVVGIQFLSAKVGELRHSYADK